jgi:hypothetical protein
VGSLRRRETAAADTAIYFLGRSDFFFSSFFFFLFAQICALRLAASTKARRPVGGGCAYVLPFPLSLPPSLLLPPTLHTSARMAM